jgi:hypothetical protein
MGIEPKTHNPGRMKERRRFGRFSARMPCRTRLDDSAPDSAHDRRAACRLELRDFSLGGMRVESPKPLKVNDRVTISLPPSGRHPPVHLTGRVIHCRRQAKGYDVGIEFHEQGSSPRQSPYVGLPRLFSMAAEYGGTLRPSSNSHTHR